MAQIGIEESERILGKYGLRLFPLVRIRSEKDTAKIAEKLGYPAVMKAFSRSIIHKSKSGLVKTNIRDKKGLLNSYRKFVSLLGRKKIRDYSIIVQSQISGIEFIIGAKHDATFGYAVIFGLGGVYTEALRKISMRICPITARMANEMVDEIAGSILHDRRAKAMVADVIIKAAKLAEKEKIAEMDLNPAIVNENGVHLVDVRK